MDVGTLDSGEPFLVMEYLDGEDLSELLEKRRSLSVQEAVSFMLQTCDGVAAAHALGIIHRDLKPANLYIAMGSDGLPCVKVLDFGIAKATSGTGFNMTSTSTVMGTPLYMSPEQMRSSKDVDARSDIWSLGVILFQMLTGTVPFLGDSMPELVLAVMQNPVPPIRRPDVPIELCQIIESCLEKDPSKRMSSLGALSRALAAFGDEDAPKTAARISRVLGESSAAGGAASRVSLPDAGLPDLPTAPLPTSAALGVVSGAATVPVARSSGGVALAVARLDGPTDLNMGTVSTQLRITTIAAMAVVAVVGFGALGFVLSRPREGGAASPATGSSNADSAMSASAPNTGAAAPSSVPVVPATTILAGSGDTDTKASASSSAAAPAKTSGRTPAVASPAKTSKGSAAPTGFGDRQ
jgi:serine/threonine-protein kinase